MKTTINRGSAILLLSMFFALITFVNACLAQDDLPQDCWDLNDYINAGDLIGAEQLLERNGNHCAILLIKKYVEKGNTQKAKELLENYKNYYRSDISETYKYWLYYSLLLGVVDESDTDSYWKNLNYGFQPEANNLKKELSAEAKKIMAYCKNPFEKSKPEVPYLSTVLFDEINSERINNIDRNVQLYKNYIRSNDYSQTNLTKTIDVLTKLKTDGVEVGARLNDFKKVKKFYEKFNHAKKMQSQGSGKEPSEILNEWNAAKDASRAFSGLHYDVKKPNIGSEIDLNIKKWDLTVAITKGFSKGLPDSAAVKKWRNKAQSLASNYKPDSKYMNSLELVEKYVSAHSIMNHYLGVNDSRIEFLNKFNSHQEVYKKEVFQTSYEEIIADLKKMSATTVICLRGWLEDNKPCCALKNTGYLVKDGNDFDEYLKYVEKGAQYYKYLSDEDRNTVAYLVQQKEYLDLFNKEQDNEKKKTLLGKLNTKIISSRGLQGNLEIHTYLEEMKVLVQNDEGKASKELIPEFEALRGKIINSYNDNQTNFENYPDWDKEYSEFFSKFHEHVMIMTWNFYKNEKIDEGLDFLTKRIDGNIYKSFGHKYQNIKKNFSNENEISSASPEIKLYVYALRKKELLQNLTQNSMNINELQFYMDPDVKNFLDIGENKLYFGKKSSEERDIAKKILDSTAISECNKLIEGVKRYISNEQYEEAKKEIQFALQCFKDLDSDHEQGKQSAEKEIKELLAKIKSLQTGNQPGDQVIVEAKKNLKEAERLLYEHDYDNAKNKLTDLINYVKESKLSENDQSQIIKRAKSLMDQIKIASLRSSYCGDIHSNDLCDKYSNFMQDFKYLDAEKLLLTEFKQNKNIKPVIVNYYMLMANIWLNNETPKALGTALKMLNSAGDDRWAEKKDQEEIFAKAGDIFKKYKGNSRTDDSILEEDYLTKESWLYKKLTSSTGDDSGEPTQYITNKQEIEKLRKGLQEKAIAVAKENSYFSLVHNLLEGGNDNIQSGKSYDPRNELKKAVRYLLDNDFSVNEHLDNLQMGLDTFYRYEKGENGNAKPVSSGQGNPNRMSEAEFIRSYVLALGYEKMGKYDKAIVTIHTPYKKYSYSDEMDNLAKEMKKYFEAMKAVNE
ncbi:hypothetical protein [Desulfatibacillum aliphaticivorans]|uniref:hypothetical protein n=1 Tax=Desulfatibacillum aliphaticivorans TaxID=218208 RepID=UPI00040B7319|nr:hypothetical protein [Desulfatibacillum aliphaticivorans]